MLMHGARREATVTFVVGRSSTRPTSGRTAGPHLVLFVAERVEHLPRT